MLTANMGVSQNRFRFFIVFSPSCFGACCVLCVRGALGCALLCVLCVRFALLWVRIALLCVALCFPAHVWVRIALLCVALRARVFRRAWLRVSFYFLPFILRYPAVHVVVSAHLCVMANRATLRVPRFARSHLLLNSPLGSNVNNLRKIDILFHKMRSYFMGGLKNSPLQNPTLMFDYFVAA
jgi:hypothetical protein